MRLKLTREPHVVSLKNQLRSRGTRPTANNTLAKAWSHRGQPSQFVDRTCFHFCHWSICRSCSGNRLLAQKLTEFLLYSHPCVPESKRGYIQTKKSTCIFLSPPPSCLIRYLLSFPLVPPLLFLISIVFQVQFFRFLISRVLYNRASTFSLTSYFINSLASDAFCKPEKFLQPG